MPMSSSTAMGGVCEVIRCRQACIMHSKAAAIPAVLASLYHHPSSGVAPCPVSDVRLPRVYARRSPFDQAGLDCFTVTSKRPALSILDMADAINTPVAISERYRSLWGCHVFEKRQKVGRPLYLHSATCIALQNEKLLRNIVAIEPRRLHPISNSYTAITAPHP